MGCHTWCYGNIQKIPDDIIEKAKIENQNQYDNLVYVKDQLTKFNLSEIKLKHNYHNIELLFHLTYDEMSDEMKKDFKIEEHRDYFLIYFIYFYGNYNKISHSDVLEMAIDEVEKYEFDYLEMDSLIHEKFGNSKLKVLGDNIHFGIEVDHDPFRIGDYEAGEFHTREELEKYLFDENNMAYMSVNGFENNVFKKFESPILWRFHMQLKLDSLYEKTPDLVINFG